MSTQKNGEAPAPIEGMAALAKAFNELPADHAAYSRERLSEPIESNFGSKTEKRTLEIGRAKILEEIKAGQLLMFTVITEDGKNKVIEIGHTPDENNPSRGGEKMVGVGRDKREAGKYLMLVHGGEHSPTSVRYLSDEELEGVSVAPGDTDLTFNPFMDSESQGRAITVSGTVEKVVTLE